MMSHACTWFQILCDVAPPWGQGHRNSPALASWDASARKKRSGPFVLEPTLQNMLKLPQATLTVSVCTATIGWQINTNKNGSYEL